MHGTIKYLASAQLLMHDNGHNPKYRPRLVCKASILIPKLAEVS